MKYAQFVLWFILFFLFVGYASAKYDNFVWQYVYYSWDKLKDLLLVILVIWQTNTNKRLKLAWKILAYFLAARVVWEQVVFIFHADINHPLAIFWFFLAAWLIIISIILHPYIKKCLR